ncbi:MAG: transcriptional regulator [Phycisphaerales bacterium]|nr:transcriptional regulator [Phycisphaerales bacterium]
MSVSVRQFLPRHAQVIIDLEEMISCMKIGDRLLPERDLSAHFKVSRETVRKAVTSLCRLGILEARQGAGTFILRPLDKRPAPRVAAKLVGISIPSVIRPESAQMVAGAELRAREENYRVVLSHDHDEPDRQVGLIREMLDMDLDGMLIYPDRDNVLRPEYLAVLQSAVDRKIPMVLLDRYVPGLRAPAVLTDNVRGMYLATEHLILSGRRRFAMLSFGDAGGTSERDRVAGFRNAMRDFGLSPEPILHAELGFGVDNEISARAALNQWLANEKGELPFDAIVSFHDNMAYGAFLALKDAGLSVPNDVALVGYDNFDREVYRVLGLKLTSIEQPMNEIGHRAMDALLAEIANGNASSDPKHILLSPKLIVRSSCGANY